MDTKFSVAVHALILISESPKPIDSERMAKSVGTNASYIRKILGLLKRRISSAATGVLPAFPCCFPRSGSRCCGCIKP